MKKYFLNEVTYKKGSKNGLKYNENTLDKDTYKKVISVLFLLQIPDFLRLSLCDIDIGNCAHPKYAKLCAE